MLFVAGIKQSKKLPTNGCFKFYHNQIFRWKLNRNRKFLPFLASSDDKNPVAVMRRDRNWPNRRLINVCLVQISFSFTIFQQSPTTIYSFKYWKIPNKLPPKFFTDSIWFLKRIMMHPQIIPGRII